MRKVVVATFVSLDGVMQAPGGPEEDVSGGFRFVGWTVPYWSETAGDSIDELFGGPFDLLLGRRTYDIFASYWPDYPADGPAASIAEAFNGCVKHVATHHPETLRWSGSRALGPDAAAAVRALKATSGPDLVVQGSSDLIHQLLAADLVDALRLMVFPVVLGSGKRWFDAAAQPAAYVLETTQAASTGVVINIYRREGEVRTGSFD